MSKWQPIETAPNDGTQFLAYGDGNGVESSVYICSRRYGLDGWREAYTKRAMRPTHWMPLPEPPPSNT
jgi:hypothetical protein